MRLPSPGQRLFESYTRHVTWNMEGLPAPEQQLIHADDGHFGAQYQSEAHGRGHLAAQSFDSGLLASSMKAELHHPLTRYNSHDDGFAPVLALQLLMSGGCSWTDWRGREHLSGRSSELWTQRGRIDWRQGTLRAGLQSQCHVMVSTELLENWLIETPHGGARQRIERCLNAPDVADGFCVRHLPAGMNVLALSLQQLLQGLQPPTLPQRLQIEGLATALLGIWFELPDTLPAGQGSRWQRAVQDAIDIIRHEQSGDLSIAGLSRRVGLNECYLKRAFRQHTGQSIAAFVRQERLNTALALLEEGRMPVHEVARHVGYANPSQFARAFQATHGYRPSDVQPACQRHNGHHHPPARAARRV
ncbi:MAG: helix-turn-helix transcriptional regulator [Lautropia sp.]|nr:helix-turn-helix transcriptional regulator [Lautropia sp.]